MAAGLAVRRLGLRDYAEVWEAMKAFTRSRGPETPDELWAVQHPTVLTLGTGADPSNIFPNCPFPVVQTDRGGEVTCHTPGQVVVYLLLDLRRRHLLVRPMVRLIEDAMIATLAGFGIEGLRHDGAPGIYVAAPGGEGEFRGTEKIGALGLKVSRGCTYHGLSLNVRIDRRAFLAINPCGYAGLRTADMAQMGFAGTVAEVEDKLLENLTLRLQQ